MTENPENPSQALIQERAKRDPAIAASVAPAAIPNGHGCFVCPGCTTRELP